MVTYWTFYWKDFIFKAAGKKEFSSSSDGRHTLLSEYKIIHNYQQKICHLNKQGTTPHRFQILQPGPTGNYKINNHPEIKYINILA